MISTRLGVSLPCERIAWGDEVLLRIVPPGAAREAASAARETATTSSAEPSSAPQPRSRSPSPSFQLQRQQQKKLANREKDIVARQRSLLARTGGSTRNLPFPMAVATVVNCVLWLMYGSLVTHDPFVWAPNVLGLTSGLVQLALFARYGIALPAVDSAGQEQDSQ